MDVDRAAVTTNHDTTGMCWITDIFELKISPHHGLPRITSDEAGSLFPFPRNWHHIRGISY
jgi:hypothetical protein